MADVPLMNVLFVVAIAFSAPLILGLAPSLRVPAVVLEILAGIAVGPSGLGWVEIDEPVEILALIGLSFLLFSAGLEIDLRRLRGRALRLASASFALSLAIAVAAGLALDAGGLVSSHLLVAIILVSTSLGIVVPVLKDAGEVSSPFGQLIIASSSIADFGAIILLTLFFSSESGTSTQTKLVLLGGFVLVVASLAFAISRAERSSRISAALLRLQDTTAQIRVRGAFLLLVGFAVLAESLGLETILGAFAAGAILAALDRDEAMTHPEFRLKLEAVGFGVFIPAFFVASGLRFDLGALFSSAETLAYVPAFLFALTAVRGLPVLLYRAELGTRRTAAAALLQATSLPFIVAASMIGLDLGLISEASAAALIAAGLLSVVFFPVAALALLRGDLAEDPAGPGLGEGPLEPGVDHARAQ
jgi:Kef-type K+ transport system membrane component KefB